MKRTALKQKTPLLRKTPLRAKAGLKQMSVKTKAELEVWQQVKIIRMIALQRQYDYIPCEYCFKSVVKGHPFFYPEGHHNNHNRRINTLENCRILHRVCNQWLEDNNIRDVPSLL